MTRHTSQTTPLDREALEGLPSSSPVTPRAEGTYHVVSRGDLELGELIAAVTAPGREVDTILDGLDCDQLRHLVVELVVLLESRPAARPQTPTGLSPADVCSETARLAAQLFDVPVAAVVSRDRHRPIADARAVAQMAARNCGLTRPAIGAHYGQHHSAVIHSIEKVASTPRLRSAAIAITERVVSGFGRIAA